MKNETVEMTNPVINTAKMTLSYLSSAGVEEAVEFAQKLGYTEFRRNFTEFSGTETDRTNALSQEVRYEFLNRNIRKSGRKNIMDIACGFSPRGLVMAKEGCNYLGLDLAVSVAALSKVAEESKNDNLGGNFSYSVCDITNENSVIEAADRFEGEITIVCEGLFMYLKDFEIASFCEGLRRVLKKHGGTFYTPDFSSLQFYLAIMKSIHGTEKAMELLLKMGAELRQKSDTSYFGLTSQERLAEAVPFFNKHGLKVETIPYYEDEKELNAFNLLPPGVKDVVKKNLSEVQAWKVTYDEALDSEDSANVSDKDFNASYTLNGGTLNVEIEGRVDSVTAPAFVELFEKAKASGTIRNITVETKNLTYISSAGLRVLMIMKKHIGENEVIVKNACDVVKNIFAQTGFDGILTLEE